MGKRIRWAGVVLALCFALLFVQLVNVQYRKAAALANSPQNPQVIHAQLNLDRGDILAADGTVLAQSIKAPSGLRKYERVYPTGSLFEQIVGYDSPIYGSTGVEESYNHYLIAHTQQAQSFAQLFETLPEVNNNVTLTVLPKLQATIQEDLSGRPGAAVVINPSSGAVLAMYSNPSFNPNGLTSPSTAAEMAAFKAVDVNDAEGFGPLSAMSYQDYFQPGSSFKVITASAVYDHDPSVITKTYPEATQISLPNTNLKFHNYHFESCGGDIAQMLPPSCDTGFAEVGLDVGAQSMYDEATGFGYNQVPPLDIPGAIASTFPAVSQIQAPNLAYLAYASIGQDLVKATPLQDALEACAIADRGTIMTPHVMDKVTDSQGNVVTTYQPKAWLHATSPSTAASVGALMRQVVTSPDGTAHNVGFPASEDVAAKTGTAETGLTTNPLTEDWMVAYAPANHPRVCASVLLPNQIPSSTGAENSGPIMKSILQLSLALTTGSSGARSPVTTTTAPATTTVPATTTTPAATTTVPVATTTTEPTTTTVPVATTTAPTTVPPPGQDLGAGQHQQASRRQADRS